MTQFKVSSPSEVIASWTEVRQRADPLYRGMLAQQRDASILFNKAHQDAETLEQIESLRTEIAELAECYQAWQVEVVAISGSLNNLRDHLELFRPFKAETGENDMRYTVAGAGGQLAENFQSLLGALVKSSDEQAVALSDEHWNPAAGLIGIFGGICKEETAKLFDKIELDSDPIDAQSAANLKAVNKGDSINYRRDGDLLLIGTDQFPASWLGDAKRWWTGKLLMVAKGSSGELMVTKKDEEDGVYQEKVRDALGRISVKDVTFDE